MSASNNISTDVRVSYHKISFATWREPREIRPLWFQSNAGGKNQLSCRTLFLACKCRSVRFFFISVDWLGGALKQTAEQRIRKPGPTNMSTLMLALMSSPHIFIIHHTSKVYIGPDNRQQIGKEWWGEKELNFSLVLWVNIHHPLYINREFVFSFSCGSYWLLLWWFIQTSVFLK